MPGLFLPCSAVRWEDPTGALEGASTLLFSAHEEGRSEAVRVHGPRRKRAPGGDGRAGPQGLLGGRGGAGPLTRTGYEGPAALYGGELAARAMDLPRALSPHYPDRLKHFFLEQLQPCAAEELPRLTGSQQRQQDEEGAALLIRDTGMPLVSGRSVLPLLTVEDYCCVLDALSSVSDITPEAPQLVRPTLHVMLHGWHAFSNEVAYLMYYTDRSCKYGIRMPSSLYGGGVKGLK
eukprot:scaffold134254_cov18-Tisochrysis_lutea.AAC.1